MTLKDKSAARRFITLIDTFYDAKVRVICGAEDYPEKLFTSQTDNCLKVGETNESSGVRFVVFFRAFTHFFCRANITFQYDPEFFSFYLSKEASAMRMLQDDLKIGDKSDDKVCFLFASHLYSFE